MNNASKEHHEFKSMSTCPLCDSKSISHIGTRNNFSLVYCTQCFFVFLDQDFDYADYYNDFYYENYHNASALFDEKRVLNGAYSYSDSAILHRKTYAEALCTVEKFVTIKGLRYLDIGCAEGLGLEVAKEKGMAVYGIDVSPHSIDECHKKGYANTFVTELIHSKDQISNMDVVTMLDVLEHIKDPRSNLQALSGVVKMGGYVYVNNNFFSLKQFLSDTQYFAIRFEPPFHCSYFSEKQAVTLFESYGFELVYKRPGFIKLIFKCYAFIKQIFSKEFRVKKKKMLSERVPTIYNEGLQGRLRLGNRLKSMYPTGLLFKKIK